MGDFRAILKRLTTGLLPAVALLGLLLVALYLLSEAAADSARLGRLYSRLLVVNAAGSVILIGLITINLYRLVRQFRARVLGSRLTLRMLAMFVILAFAPVSVVYYFSVKFLVRGIDSWFDVRVEQALDDALELSRAALDERMRVLLRQTETMAGEFSQVPDVVTSLNLLDLRIQSSAYELTLMSNSGRIISSSSIEATQLVPHRPGEGILSQVRRGDSYVGLDPIGDLGLHVRVVVPAPPARPAGEGRILQALYPVTERVNSLAGSVQSAYAQYRELVYLRKPLRYSFILTLSLVLLLSLLYAVWAAFASTRRLVAPIRDLAEGTRAVAEGDYDKQLSSTGYGELGSLVSSFNDMTRKLATARDQARRSQHQVEGQRAYLETVLGSLSSGVFSAEPDGTLRTANAAAGQILGVDLHAYTGRPLAELAENQPGLRGFVDALVPHLKADRLEWSEELTVFGAGGRRVLMCRGAALPAGHVVVFDDITALIQAQRDAAWGEVARRLAHEIKNPLTPIQLSAERLRHKFLKKMSASDAEVLERSTNTIIQQVEAMKKMVNAFADYARPPRMERSALDLNALVNEVLDLYRSDNHHVEISIRRDPRMPPIEADSGRLRQLLHNLVKNALESVEGRQGGKITLTTHCAEEAGCRFVELRVEDNGPGFREDMLDRLFEPYVTTKPKGTGLGLAIVKKIVEEHGGIIQGKNLDTGGACIVIRLPVKEADVRGKPVSGSNSANLSRRAM